MSPRQVDAELARDALCQRLLAVAEALDLHPEPGSTAAETAAQCLLAATRTIGADPQADQVWLLLAAMAGAFPHESDVRSAMRTLELSAADDAAAWLLERAFQLSAERGSPYATLEIQSSVVIDVAYTATHDLNTGIQRVVRQTVPHWQAWADVCLVAWTDRGGAMRRIDPAERNRVLDWGGHACTEPAETPTVIVAPWRTTVVLTEVPPTSHCPGLSSLAQFSGNTVVGIGYDCIPIVSADMLPAAEPEKFVQYLSVMKFAKRISAISASAADEFQGFSSMLPAQGLEPPQVAECPLPVESPEQRRTPAPTDVPTVLCVGSLEPRKNHVSVLAAAERLWREGHAFRLRLIGGSGWSTTELDGWFRRLRRRRRPVSVERSVGDEMLWDAYRAARFTVFPSLHEGYGLPVAESLAVGTPAITSDFGSMAELAHQGGALTVDPTDLDTLTAAMRSLLLDDALLAQLTTAAMSRTPRTWADYARESWHILTNHVVAP